MGGTGGVDAVGHSLVLRADHALRAAWAGLGHNEFALAAGSPIGYRADYLGDDLARALRHNPIAYSQVLFADVRLVVEGGLLDGGAADDYGFQNGVGV